MGRNQTSIVHQHFIFDKTMDKSTCKLCKIDIKGNHATNLKNHLMRIHPELQLSDKNENREKSIISQPSEPSTSKIRKQGTLLDINKIKVALSKDDILNACVEMVTVNGRPLAAIQDSGFRKILNPILNAIKPKPTVTSSTIRNLVQIEAKQLRRDISADIENTMVCLKIDAVTRMDRAFLGVNVQYSKGDQIILRTLGLIEIKERHTGEHLCEIITELCQRFGIVPQQIYTVTTDNGANMLKAVELLSEKSQTETIESENEKEEEEEELLEKEKIVIQIYDDDIVEQGSGEKIVEEEILTIIDQEIDFSSINTGGIRCAAHTMQLAIDDSLKVSPHVTKVIDKSRTLLKKLRTQTYAYMIQKENLNKPMLDCPTRWNSTYDMLARLVELRTFCLNLSESDNKIKKVMLSADEWKQIEDIINALTPSKICMKKLQEEHLSAGDFCGAWIVCKTNTEKVNTKFSNLLLVNIKSREKRLLENVVFLSAIFLDPRYKIILKDEEVEKAILHLKQLHFHLWNLKSKNKDDGNIQDREFDYSQESQEPISTNTEEEDEISRQLKQRELELNNTNCSKKINDNGETIDEILQIYKKNQNRVWHKENIFNYWRERKNTDKELYTLAMVVLSVPWTQVSVERLFSGLKFILSPLRTRVKDNFLEDQIIIRANRIFNYKEKQNKVKSEEHEI